MHSSRDVEREGIAAAYRGFLDELLTEPLSVAELAELFRVPPRKVRRMLKGIEGAVRIDRSCWRVPLRAMPPNYLLAEGLIPQD